MSEPFNDPKSLDKKTLELGDALAPRFDAAGLITAIAQDARSADILMLAHMNADALALSIETGIAHYYSRSRQAIWKKGENSGDLQKIVSMRVDCDQDAILLLVEPQGHGAACHTGRRTCFYRQITGESPAEAALAMLDEAPLFDPDDVYGKS